MLRTQISFPKDLYTTVKLDAKNKGISFSEVLRQLVTEKYYKNPVKKRHQNPFAGLIKIANSFPKTKKITHLSENIDKYLPENLR